MTDFNKNLLDDRANKSFQLYLEAVLAYANKTKYSGNDDQIMDLIEEHINIENKDQFRRNLAEFYIKKEREANGNQNFVRWDTQPQVRDAILSHLKISFEEYQITMGLKHHRSIDDPWEIT